MTRTRLAVWIGLLIVGLLAACAEFWLRRLVDEFWTEIARQ